MDINYLLEQKKMSKYNLSKRSGVPQTTIQDICNGKSKIEKCSADTVYKIAKALKVSVESLIEDAIEYRADFEIFKSNICHYVKDMGDINFIIKTLEENKIRRYFVKKWYPESLYLLAMIDYLSRENGLSLCKDYDDIRATKLKEPLYPKGIQVLCFFFGNEEPKKKSLTEAIPEFLDYNIVESEIRNVC